MRREESLGLGFKCDMMKDMWFNRSKEMKDMRFNETKDDFHLRECKRAIHTSNF